MTPEEMLAALRAKIDEQLELRTPISDRITAIRAAYNGESRNPTEAESTELVAEVAKREKIDTEIEGFRAEATKIEDEIRGNELAQELGKGSDGDKKEHKRAPAKVISEERTYSAEKSARGEASFFADSFGAQQGNGPARERLQRNLQEAIVEGEISERATSTSSFAGLVVPQYLIDLAAPIVRAGRPFADICNHQQLPAQGMALIIPRGTTGASTAIQATENANVSSTDEVWANLTVPVVTVAGQQDVSRQSLERGGPGIDELIFLDLAGAYGVNVDQQVISGTGSSGQMLGVLNTAGINQATAFTAAATAQTFYSKIAGQINAVQTSRFLAPTVIAGHSRRWNWFATQLDSANRPLVVPRANGPMNALGVWDKPEDTPSVTPSGEVLGLPFVADASIPTAVGSGPEDQVIVARREDLLLWEDGDGMPRQLRFEQTLGNQLTVKLVVYNYAAFTAGRYPSAVGVVGGNSASGFGLVTPTF